MVDRPSRISKAETARSTFFPLKLESYLMGTSHSYKKGPSHSLPARLPLLHFDRNSLLVALVVATNTALLLRVHAAILFVSLLLLPEDVNYLFAEETYSCS